MALPTAPTATTIATEAWNKAGNLNPTAAQLTRANIWIQEVLNEIWMANEKSGNVRLKTLQETLLSNTVRGKNFIDLAEDFDEELEVTILDGAVRGTAQSGGATSITLASDDAMTATQASGKFIFITGGTGVGGYRQMTSLNTSTKVATVDSAWDTNPAVSSTYLIVSIRHPVDEVDIGELDQEHPLPEGIPTRFAKFERQIIFDRPFDLATYGVLTRYYMSPNQVDLVEGTTRITRIYRNWQSVLTKGVQYKAEEAIGDARYVKTQKDFQDMVRLLMIREIPYGGQEVQLGV